MTLPRSNASVESSWLHNPAVGTYLSFVFGVGAIFRRPIRSYEDCYPSVRSLHTSVTRLANLGAIANLGHLREYEAQGGYENGFLWASCKEVT